MKWSFDYGYTRVGELKLHGSAGLKSGKAKIRGIELGGELVEPTPRFWRSFFTRFGVSDNTFRYFEPAEVVQRVSQRAPDDSIRYCIQRDEQGQGKLLAVSNPRRPVITHGEICDLVSRYDSRDMCYENGVVTSSHTPRSGDGTFKIGDDSFQNRFVMETPVDGFSHPKIYLSLLRMICTNGAIGYSRAFRSDISLGKDISHCITRALESFDNGDGYAALRQRFESAQRSWASLNECVQLYKTLDKLTVARRANRHGLVRDFCRMTGNMNEFYGLANLDALSTKRQRVLPARCRVYDLINFASEVATHHATAAGSQAMQAYIGTLISDEYDMEGTAEAAGEFSDFFVDAPSDSPQPSLN